MEKASAMSQGRNCCWDWDCFWVGGIFTGRFRLLDRGIAAIKLGVRPPIFQNIRSLI
jgi:hypothetical protein